MRYSTGNARADLVNIHQYDQIGIVQGDGIPFGYNVSQSGNEFLFRDLGVVSNLVDDLELSIPSASRLTSAGRSANLHTLNFRASSFGSWKAAGMIFFPSTQMSATDPWVVLEIGSRRCTALIGRR